MRSVDVHQHLWPPQLVEALERRPERPRLRDRGRRLELEDGTWDVDLREHELDARLALLDRNEVDVAVVSLAPTLGVYELPDVVAAYHEGIGELVAASGGRIAALGAGDSRDAFPGACVAASALIADPGRFRPLFAALERRGAFLFVHPGPGSETHAALPWWPAVVDYTAQQQAAYALWLGRTAADHPELKVVFAILAGGAPIQLERMRTRGSDMRSAHSPNVFLDTASYGRRALELCLATFGVGRLVYGSDVPVIDPRPTAEALANFGTAVSHAIRRENPSLILP